MDELGRHVLLQKNYIGLCIQYIVSVCICVCRLSLIRVCARRTEKMWDILVAPIRGCAHVKVYLKSFNEAWSNGSWSCRHTSLTLFHWRQWGRRECGVVPSDLATVERRQLQCTWAKGPHVFFWDSYLPEIGPEDVCHGSRVVKEAFLFAIPGLQFEWVVCGLCVNVFCLPYLHLSPFFSLARCNVHPCSFFPLFEPSALHRVGKATRCERWSVWLALMVLSWMTLNVMLPPDPLTPR